MFFYRLIEDFFEYGLRGFFEWADPHMDRTIEKHIQQLKNEPWFSELFNDPGYAQIINSHKGVRSILFREQAVDLCLNDEVFRSKFIKAIIEEAAKAPK